MIAHGPICKYSLEGLPEKHRCPECGFEYDVSADLFPAPVRAWAIAAAFNGTAFFMVVVLVWIKRGSLFPVPPWILLLIVGFTVFAATHYRRAARSAVLLTDHRVYVIRNRAVALSVVLDEIDDFSIVQGAIVFYRGGNEVGRIRTVAHAAVAAAIRPRLTKCKADWIRNNSQYATNAGSPEGKPG